MDKKKWKSGKNWWKDMNKNTWFCSDYLERLIFLMNPREEKEYCRWLFHTADLPTPPKLFVESHWRWLHFLIFQYCSHVLLLLYPKNFQQMLVLVNCPDLIIFWPRGERFVDSRHCPLVKYSTFVRLCKEISCPTKSRNWLTGEHKAKSYFSLTFFLFFRILEQQLLQAFIHFKYFISFLFLFYDFRKYFRKIIRKSRFFAFRKIQEKNWKN